MSFKITFGLVNLLSLWLLSACFNPSKHLEPNQYLLHRQEIKGNNTVKSEALQGRLRQKLNTRIFSVLPYGYVGFYYFGKRRYDKEKIDQQIQETERNYAKAIEEQKDKPFKVKKLRKKRDKKLTRLERSRDQGNWWMRVVGEAPTIFDLKVNQDIRSDMERYLFTKGYFQGKVTLKIDTLSVRKKRIGITFLVEEGLPYHIRRLSYLSNNLLIDSILAKYPTNIINKGDNYDSDNIDKERVRMEEVLRKNGFYKFNRAYISIEVDSSVVDSQYIALDTLLRKIEVKDRKVDMRFIINDPVRKDTVRLNENTFGDAAAQVSLDEIRGEHIQYTIKNVYFITRNNDFEAIDTTKHLLYPSSGKPPVKYTASSSRFSHKILKNKILLGEGQVYNDDNFRKTQANLGALDMFKFVNVLSIDDRRGGLDVNIVTRALEKYAITSEAGFNVTQGLPGPFVSLSLKNRNPFQGCEVFENSIFAGIDGQTSLTSDNQIYSSTELGFNSSLSFPQILFPGKFKERFNDLNPRTRLLLSFNFVNRPEYIRRNYKAAFIYTLQKAPYERFTLTPLDFNINSTDKSADFDRELQRLDALGSTFSQSFQNSLITSTIFTYEYNDINITRNEHARFWRVYAESGGTSLNYLNQALFGNENRILGINYFKFLKFSLDFHYYLPLGKHSTFVTRFVGGIGAPYGESQTLPYEKFFFSGGSNSIRAWPPRRLGPGSFDRIDEAGNVSFRFEQPGNIQLEANAELRGKIWWIFNWAFFVDMGNIWTLQKEEARPGSEFSRDFLQEIAVGTGVGLRLDFTFLVLRFDIGVKAYDPALPAGNRWVLNNVSFRNILGGTNQAVLNVGIGYPF